MKTTHRRRMSDFSNAIEVSEFTNPIAKEDLTWFQHNPQCHYHLREPFAGEYGIEDTPPPYRWYVLVQMSIDQTPLFFSSNDGGKTGRSAHYIQLGHIPVACSPVDGDFLHHLTEQQTTAKNQRLLRKMWHNWLDNLKKEKSATEEDDA